MGAGEMVSGVKISPEKEEILLVYNLVPSKPAAWCLPGGRVEEDETPAEAMAREWAEETGQGGIKLGHAEKITRHGSSGEYDHCFFPIKSSSKKGFKKEPTPNEVGPPHWIPFREIFSGKYKAFPTHLQGVLKILEKMAKKKNDLGFLFAELEKFLKTSQSRELTFH